MIKTSQALRQEFYAKNFPNFWANIDNYDYGLYDVHTTTIEEINKLKAATNAGWHIFIKVANVVRSLDDETLIDMGIPENALEVCRLKYIAGETVVGRFDFIKHNNDFKIIELNAETPYFNWESHCIGGQVARSFGMLDPNAEAETLFIDNLRKVVERSGASTRNVAVTAYNPYRECYFTAQYIRECLSRAINAPVRFTPIHELEARKNQVFDKDGPIDILYRSYPLEFMAIDSGGPEFFEAIKNENVFVINPPSALLIQNKLVQAIIWGLMENNAFFNDYENKLIRQYFLPSYTDLPQNQKDYIRKPVFGREGSGVAIVNSLQSESSEDDYYGKQPMLYQKYIAQPKINYTVGDKQESGYGIHTMFVVNGTPTAAGLRVSSEKITDGWAHFLPLGIEI